MLPALAARIAFPEWSFSGIARNFIAPQLPVFGFITAYETFSRKPSYAKMFSITVPCWWKYVSNS